MIHVPQYFGAVPDPGSTDISRDDAPLSPADYQATMAYLQHQERQQQIADQNAAGLEKKKQEMRFNGDVRFVCKEAPALHKSALIELADGVSQLSVAFRDELLPKKKGRSVLADAHMPVITMEQIDRTFNRLFSFIKKSVNKANQVFKASGGEFDFENVNSLDSLFREIEEHVTANKLTELFGASCINAYENFINKTKSLQNWWYSGASANFDLMLGWGYFLSAEHDANVLLGLTRQPKNPPSKVSFASTMGGRLSKRTLRLVSQRDIERKQRISRIYGAGAREGVWPTKIKTCGEWDYFRALLARFDDYMQDSWAGFNRLSSAGADLKANQPKFADVISASASFCSSVIVALNRLAGISVDSISGDAARMRSRLKAAVTSQNSTARAYARNFQKHQIETNLGFWYGLEKMEDYFADLAGVAKANWKRANKEENLYNLGLVMHGKLNSIVSSFENIIEYYSIVNDSSVEGSLVGNANSMISEGNRYKGLIEANRAHIDQNLASFTNLNTYLGINSLTTLIGCSCDGHPLPAGRFSSVQRALIAKYYNCSPR